MKEFRLPQKLTDLETQSDDALCVVYPIDLESIDPDACIDILNSIKHLILIIIDFSSEVIDSRSFETITDQHNFDIVYSFMKFDLNNDKYKTQVFR